MKYDRSKLKGRIIEKFGKQSVFAEKIGISIVSMSKKLTGKIAISTDDIIEWSKPELLDIPPSEYHLYFFVHKVQGNEL